jgi:hypothetical protein
MLDVMLTQFHTLSISHDLFPTDPYVRPVSYVVFQVHVFQEALTNYEFISSTSIKLFVQHIPSSMISPLEQKHRVTTPQRMNDC